MGEFTAFAALVLAIVGPLGALAYRNDRKWSTFHGAVSRTLLVIFFAACAITVGLWFAFLFPANVKTFLVVVGYTSGAALLGLALLELANWLREP